MNINNHKRLKMGMEPGDISKRAKIQMLEDPHRACEYFGRDPQTREHHIADLSKAARGFKRHVLGNQKAVLKVRTLRAIKEQLEDQP